ncbi:glutathione S-transferase C-terminal domain-containing protein [Phreatobacter stygius]|nr:glutathione S-transferase C-terminal domain-containing protein [Phreatobacter stygius]
MHLYASPMACSLASHITILEAGLPVTVHYIDNRTKVTDEGEDYWSISPNGYVPALRLASGEVLNEGPSVLQFLADQKPEAKLAPAWGTTERYQLIDALNYLSTEVHKRIFSTLLTAKAPEDAKARAKSLLAPTLDAIARRLGDRDHLVGDHFSVADAYLVVLLNWCRHVGTDLRQWPTIAAYHKRQLARPAVAAAVAQETAEYQRRAA